MEMPLSEFHAAHWVKLSSAERVRQCRLMAEEARDLSEGASGEIRRGYMELSLSWDQLEDEIAKTIPK
jgi:hypothetical protein